MKINNPNQLKFPINIGNESEWKRLVPRLKALGYTWGGNGKNVDEWNPFKDMDVEIKSTQINSTPQKWLSHNYNEK